MTEQLQPNELTFMLNEDTNIVTGGPEIGVFFMPKDHDHELADELRRDDIANLPDYFDVEEAENFFTIQNGDLETIKADLISLGFTFVENDED